MKNDRNIFPESVVYASLLGLDVIIARNICSCLFKYTLYILVQLARRCERVLINKYLDVFYSEFVTLLHDDREEGN